MVFVSRTVGEFYEYSGLIIFLSAKYDKFGSGVYRPISLFVYFI